MALSRSSTALAGSLKDETRQVIQKHMQVINAYYSNLIEGNNTEPHQIRAAQKGEYESEPTKRDLQQESVAYSAS